jgi:hypothetical protein
MSKDTIAGVMSGDWPQDRIDAEMLNYEDGDPADECGGWINGRFSWHDCQLAGTEFCDWDCPFAKPFQRLRIAALKPKGETS